MISARSLTLPNTATNRRSRRDYSKPPTHTSTLTSPQSPPTLTHHPLGHLTRARCIIVANIDDQRAVAGSERGDGDGAERGSPGGVEGRWGEWE
jgi:hypothetical protein